jgi:hypothetical protein
MPLSLVGITYDPTLLLHSLATETRDHQLRSLADNSWASAGTALKAYARYCYFTKQYPDPKTGITDEQLAQYATFLARTLTHGAVCSYISMGVRRLHEETGMPWRPANDRPAVRAVLKGIGRLKGTGPTKRKLPITPEILIGLKSKMNLDDVRDLSMFACWLTMFYGFLRKGNATWNKGKAGLSEADQDKHNKFVIRRENLQKINGRYQLTVKGTKTIQFGQRELVLVLPCIPGSEICPTAILDRYLAVTHRRPANEALFGTISAKNQWVPLDYQHMLRTLKKGMKLLNVDHAAYAGHSFRRGGATHAFLAGVPEHIIRLMGDWKSDVWREYAEVQLELRRRAAATVEESLAHGLPHTGGLGQANLLT